MVSRESAGMVHCRHYGMEFQDEIHLGNHFRMYFLCALLHDPPFPNTFS